MRARLAQREVALAGVALLGAVGAIAAADNGDAKPPHGPVPQGSYVALAGSSGPAAFGHRTACGAVLHAETEGVAHPTLPCGVKLFITYRGKTVLTEVVDRGPFQAGRQFNLTDALARRLGLRGVQQVEWAYARSG
jgi:rare lipoprotein A (peptidoglycan hydrolase)